MKHERPIRRSPFKNIGISFANMSLDAIGNGTICAPDGTRPSPRADTSSGDRKSTTVRMPRSLSLPTSASLSWLSSPER
jgi:hypothetical protein